MAVGVCALGVVLGVVDHGREAAQIVVMVWRLLCALMPFGVWLPMGVKLLRSGRWCGGRCGVSAHGIEVAQIVGEVCLAYQGVKYNIYIYNVLWHYQTKITLN